MAKKKKDPSLEESMLELRGETASPDVLSDENLAKVENLPAGTKSLLEQRTGATPIPQAADGTMGLNLVAPAPAFRMGSPAPRPLPAPAVVPTGVAAIPRQPSVESSDLRTRMGGEPLLAPTGVAAIPRQPSVESSDLRTRMGGEPLRTPPAPRPVPAPAVVPTLPPPNSVERADAFLSSPKDLVRRPTPLMVPGAEVVKPRTPEQALNPSEFDRFGGVGAPRVDLRGGENDVTLRPLPEPAPVPAFRTTTPMVPRALPEPVAEVARPKSEEQSKAGMEKERAADTDTPRDLYVERYGEEGQYTGLMAAPAAPAAAAAAPAAAATAPASQNVLVRTPYGTILATPEQAERLQTPYIEQTPESRYLDRVQTLRDNRAAVMKKDRENFAEGEEGDKAFAAKWNSPQYRSIIDQTSVVAPEYTGKRNPDELSDWFKQRQAEFTPMMGGTGGSDAVEREVQRRERAETAARRAFKQKTGSMVGAPPKNTRKDVTEQVVGETAAKARVTKSIQEARFTLEEFEQREKALQAAIDKAANPKEQAKLREELRQLQESFTQQEEAQ